MPEATASTHLQAIAQTAEAAAHSPPPTPPTDGSRWGVRLRRLTAATGLKLAAGATVVAAATGGVASVDRLPDPAQAAVADVADLFGLPIAEPPSGSDGAGDPALPGPAGRPDAGDGGSGLGDDGRGGAAGDAGGAGGLGTTEPQREGSGTDGGPSNGQPAPADDRPAGRDEPGSAPDEPGNEADGRSSQQRRGDADGRDEGAQVPAEQRDGNSQQPGPSQRSDESDRSDQSEGSDQSDRRSQRGPQSEPRQREADEPDEQGAGPERSRDNPERDRTSSGSAAGSGEATPEGDATGSGGASQSGEASRGGQGAEGDGAAIEDPGGGDRPSGAQRSSERAVQMGSAASDDRDGTGGLTAADQEASASGADSETTHGRAGRSIGREDQQGPRNPSAGSGAHTR
jgi:hypothetical protein